MESNERDAPPTPEFNDDVFAPSAVEEQPKSHHSEDDATYIDWLNTLLRKMSRSKVDAVET